MILPRMRVMLEVLPDEVRPGGCPAGWNRSSRTCSWKARPAAEEAAPEPALTGASGHPAEPRAGQSRPGPGQDDARRPDRGQPESWHPRPMAATGALPWARIRTGCLARVSPPRANEFKLITDLMIIAERMQACQHRIRRRRASPPAGRASGRGRGRQA
jgi:hypothetical protein